MKHRLAVPLLVLGLCALLGALAAPALAGKGGGQKKKQAKAKTFEVCKHGCQYRTIQKAVDAAGSLQGEEEEREGEGDRRGHARQVRRGRRPRRHPEKKNFDGLTIKGTKKNRKQDDPRRQEREGRARRRRRTGSRRSTSTASCCKNMWARNYESNGFFVHAADAGGQHCDGYTMDNLLASDNRSYGLFAKGCLRRQDDQLGRLPPRRLRLLRRRNAVRLEDLDQPRHGAAAEALPEASRSGRC